MITTVRDLGSNFYLQHDHVGKTSRAQACLDQLTELNQHVKVDVLSSLSLQDYLKYNVVCFTERFLSISDLEEVNEICRSNGVGFILSETLGLAGYAFVDYGINHVVSDPNGEKTQSFMVSNITQDEEA